jgi:predicted transcriptional regulator
MKPAEPSSQNLTIRLDQRTLRKAKILAAKHNTSISRLVARYIETLVGQDEAYERAQRQAQALLDTGLHFGGEIVVTRDEWHER